MHRGEVVVGKVKMALLRAVNVNTLMSTRLWEEVAPPPQGRIKRALIVFLFVSSPFLSGDLPCVLKS